RSGIAAPDLVTRAAAASAPLAPLLAPLTRLAAPLVGRLAERLPEGPADDVRGQAEALVVAQATAGDRTARVAVRARDGYGLTARMLVEASQQIEGTGAMATAEALQARAFLDAVAYEDVNGALSWEVL
ncbi:MAG: hypothetical protein JWN77_2239, partial [Frankiales bacterium]|nr:hypothetical protein [Frankiales bacterium]